MYAMIEPGTEARHSTEQPGPDEDYAVVKRQSPPALPERRGTVFVRPTLPPTPEIRRHPTLRSPSAALGTAWNDHTQTRGVLHREASVALKPSTLHRSISASSTPALVPDGPIAGAGFAFSPNAAYGDGASGIYDWRTLEGLDMMDPLPDELSP